MKYYLLHIFLILNTYCFGQSQEIELWKQIPNQLKNGEEEKILTENPLRISNVQTPTISIFLAAKQLTTGKAVIICPGGGYHYLSFEKEGLDFAKWLASKGITAAVLKYRLPNSPSIITSNLAPLQDIQRAIRLVRFNAEKWNINKNKIGVLGFSAGGHLASTAGTHFDYEAYTKTDEIDNISAKPDFLGLIYPVISMQNNLAHKGSKLNLLGENPSQEQVDFYSNELQVTKNTPPTFILHANNDNSVVVENSLLFYEALQTNKVPTEMHIYPLGGHGFGFAKEKGQLEKWTELYYNWLLHLE